MSATYSINEISEFFQTSSRDTNFYNDLHALNILVAEYDVTLENSKQLLKSAQVHLDEARVLLQMS